MKSGRLGGVQRFDSGVQKGGTVPCDGASLTLILDPQASPPSSHPCHEHPPLLLLGAAFPPSHSWPHSPCSPILSIALQGLLLVSLARSVGVRTLGAEELAGDVEGLASHNNDLLAVKELLGDGAGEATEQVALAVDDLRALSARRSMEECVLLTELEAGIAAECEGQYWAYRVASIGAYVQ